jgi:hypothetical protein
MISLVDDNDDDDDDDSVCPIHNNTLLVARAIYI